MVVCTRQSFSLFLFASFFFKQFTCILATNTSHLIAFGRLLPNKLSLLYSQVFYNSLSSIFLLAQLSFFLLLLRGELMRWPARVGERQ